jgi:hypothetical protein
MSNKSKKRNKKYSGWDAKIENSDVTVRKVTAVNRSAFGQWLFDHKKPIKIIGIALAVIVGIILLFTVKL